MQSRGLWGTSDWMRIIVKKTLDQFQKGINL